MRYFCNNFLKKEFHVQTSNFNPGLSLSVKNDNVKIKECAN